MNEFSGTLGAFQYSPWLQDQIKHAVDADRQHRVGFAMGVERLIADFKHSLSTDPGNGPWQRALQRFTSYMTTPSKRGSVVGIQPDDAEFWQANDQRKKDHAELLRWSKTLHWSTTTSFDPGAVFDIPVLGDIIHIAGEAVAAPFNLVKNIASGANVGDALVNAAKDQIKIVRDVAPYAQTVISLVPGIGTGVAAAIGAGAALAEGKSLDEAAKAAIKGAIPGGAIAAAGFDAAMKIASGENVGKAALESARNLVPPGPGQKAFDIGVAVATGEKLQNAVAKGLAGLAPEGVQALLGAGQKAISSIPGLAQAAKNVVGSEATKGFQLASGLLSQTGVSQKALAAVRNNLSSEAQHGFDTATKTQEAHLPWLKDVAATPLPPAVKAAMTDIYRKVAASAPHAPEPKAASHAPEPKAAPHAPEPPKPKEPPKPAPHAPEPPKPKEPPARAPTPPGAAPASAAAPGASASAYPPSTAAALYPPYPGAGRLSDELDGPPHHPRPHGPHAPHQHPFHAGPQWGGRGGSPWWATPYVPELSTAAGIVCKTWGDPIAISPPMERAARIALNVSEGRPTTVRGPDGVLYLFSLEGGSLSARPCVSTVVS